MTSTAFTPALFGFVCQAIFAEFQEGIEITEEHNRHIDALLCVRNTHERVGKRYTLFQCPLRCSLNYLTVGNGIAEWDADFDDVGSCFREFN